MAPVPIPLLHHYNSSFSLDTAGVSGFFGGEAFISALATVHLETERKWLGWYNSPGSYEIAKTYGRLASSKVWRGLFPGRREEPEVVFKLDGSTGPKYVGAFSGTNMSTGHLGYLLMEKCKQTPEELKPEGREATASVLNIVSLDAAEVRNNVNIRPRTPRHTIAFAIFPIIVSFTCCALCALGGDWFCFAMILTGILAGGISNLVIGAGEVTVDYNKKPAEGSPPGDGLLIGSELTIIKGEEQDTNIITKGCFRINSANEYNRKLAGFCSLLLLLQFIAQLFVIPQGTFMGQVWFLVSAAASWGYTSFFPSKEHDDVQQKFLWAKLGSPHIHRLRFGSRTAMVVFAMLVLKPDYLVEMVDQLLPKNTGVWKAWRVLLANEVTRVREEESEKIYESEVSSGQIQTRQSLEIAFALSDADKRLLDKLEKDLENGVKAYERFAFTENPIAASPKHPVSASQVRLVHQDSEHTLCSGNN